MQIHAKKQRGIDWLFFDIGGVLVDDSKIEAWRRKIIYAVARGIDKSISHAMVNRALDRASSIIGNLNKNAIKTLIPNQGMFEKAFTELAKHKREDAVDYFADLPVRPEALKVVAELAKHYKLGIIANQPPAARKKLSKAGLSKYFDHFGISGDHGFHKPDPRIFQVVLRQTKAESSRSVMIDDNCSRGLAPAKKFGMKVVWYKLPKAPACNFAPDFTINRLEDLLIIF